MLHEPPRSHTVLGKLVWALTRAWQRHHSHYDHSQAPVSGVCQSVTSPRPLCRVCVELSHGISGGSVAGCGPRVAGLGQAQGLRVEHVQARVRMRVRVRVCVCVHVCVYARAPVRGSHTSSSTQPRQPTAPSQSRPHATCPRPPPRDLPTAPLRSAGSRPCRAPTLATQDTRRRSAPATPRAAL